MRADDLPELGGTLGFGLGTAIDAARRGLFVAVGRGEGEVAACMPSLRCGVRGQLLLPAVSSPEDEALLEHQQCNVAASNSK